MNAIEAIAFADISDVFVDGITHILIICTASKATLLGLSRTPSELNLYHTNLQVDLPTTMLNISGTAAGRVFMNGISKEMFELEYSSGSAWFFSSSTKIALRNLSTAALNNVLPTIFRSASEYPSQSPAPSCIACEP